MIVGAFEVSAEQRESYDRIARRLYERTIKPAEAKESFEATLSIAKELKKANALMRRKIKQLDDVARLVDQLTIQEMEVFTRLLNEGCLAPLLSYEGRLRELGVHLAGRMLSARMAEIVRRYAVQQDHDVEAERTYALADNEPDRSLDPPGQIVSMSPMQSLAPPHVRVSKHRMRTQELRLAG